MTTIGKSIIVNHIIIYEREILMKQQDKVWETPQIISLSRGTPDESVLTHCKRIDNTGPTTKPEISSQDGCDAGIENNCGNCQSRSGS